MAGKDAGELPAQRRRVLSCQLGNPDKLVLACSRHVDKTVEWYMVMRLIAPDTKPEKLNMIADNTRWLTGRGTITTIVINQTTTSCGRDDVLQRPPLEKLAAKRILERSRRVVLHT